MRAPVACAFAIALAACGGDARTKRTGTLEGRVTVRRGDVVVARVGELEITGDMVRESAKARRVPARVAFASLTDDAVAARTAVDRGLDAQDKIRRSLDAALARQVLQRLRAEALARGPVTDAEVEELTQRHWKEVDLPERARVVHAVVLKKALKPEKLARAPEIAAAIRQTVLPATSGEDFEKLAKTVRADGFEVVVQPLPGFARDGRVTDLNEDGAMDAAFVTAAFDLPPGTTSGVVETSFGWHVIRLIERLPAERAPVDRRRALFADEALAARARRGYDELMSTLRNKHEIKVESYAEPLISALQLPLESKLESASK